MQDKPKDSNSPQPSFFSAFKKYFLAGIAVALPIFVTIYIVVATVVFIDNIVGEYVNSFLLKRYGFFIPGLGILAMFLIVVSIGFLSSHFIGKRIFPWLERLLIKIPFIANIYPSAKQLSDYLFNPEQKKKLKKVVLVPYPSHESYTIGFITNEDFLLLDKKEPSELISVFVPFAPTPFSGIILFFPKDKVRVLNISVDQAIKCIVSGGVIPPQ